MKGILAKLASKCAGLGKFVFVTNAKACIIAGSVCVAGTGVTVATVQYVKNNERRVAQASETDAQTEAQNNKDRLNSLVGQVGVNKEDPQYEEDLYNAIAAFVEEPVVEEGEAAPEPEPVPIIAIEDLEIVEDTSTEPPRQEEAEIIEEETGIESDKIYEINQLVHGIDVSKWQGDIDWTAVAADGITFAIIKCGGNEGGLYKDAYFEQNIQGALANGIQVGVYFYSGAYSVETAYEEASMCINLIKDYQITYPVAIDWENAEGDSEAITRACETFCNVVASYGYTPMVYSNRNRWYNYFDGECLSSKYKTWMACYFNSYYYTSQRWEYGDELPEFRYNYDMWQYGVTDTVAGIDGYVDMNIAFFGYANYEIQGAQDAKLDVKNKEIVRYLGQTSHLLDKEINLMDGVKGTNSIGYDAPVSYTIVNSAGEEVSEEDAFSTPDTYKIKYSFKDPKSGMIREEATLKIIEVKEVYNFGDFEVEFSEDNKLPADIDFVTGIVCKNSLGENAKLTKVLFKKTNVETNEVTNLTAAEIAAEVFDFETFAYQVEYTFEVPKDGAVTKSVSILKRVIQPEEGETESGSESETGSGSETSSGESGSETSSGSGSESESSSSSGSESESSSGSGNEPGESQGESSGENQLERNRANRPN